MSEGNTEQGAQPEQPVVPPLTTQQISEAEQLARFLDPDLQAAVTQGNAMVIQAIAAGAQTSDQVVTMMLRQGALPEMCPPGVRELANVASWVIEARASKTINNPPAWRRRQALLKRLRRP